MAVALVRCRLCDVRFIDRIRDQGVSLLRYDVLTKRDDLWGKYVVKSMRMKFLSGDWDLKKINLGRRANDHQPGGDHYNKYGNFQVWDIFWKFKLNPFQANVIKYVMRYRDKNGIEDLQKAKHYLEKLIEIEMDGNGDLNVADSRGKSEGQANVLGKEKHGGTVVVQSRRRSVRK